MGAAWRPHLLDRRRGRLRTRTLQTYVREEGIVGLQMLKSERIGRLCCILCHHHDTHGIGIANNSQLLHFVLLLCRNHWQDGNFQGQGDTVGVFLLVEVSKRRAVDVNHLQMRIVRQCTREADGIDAGVAVGGLDGDLRHGIGSICHRLVTNCDGLPFRPFDISYHRQALCVLSEGNEVEGAVGAETLQRFVVQENHLQRVGVGKQSLIRHRIDGSTSALGGNCDTAGQLGRSEQGGIHTHGLPSVCLVPRQFGELRCIDGQGISIGMYGRREVRQGQSVGVNHLQGVHLGAGVAECDGVGGSRHFVFCQHLDGKIWILAHRVGGYGYHLRGLRLAGEHLGQAVRTHGQGNEVVIGIGREVR